MGSYYKGTEVAAIVQTTHVERIDSGVPQGSVLSPLLYNHYIRQTYLLESILLHTLTTLPFAAIAFPP